MSNAMIFFVGLGCFCGGGLLGWALGTRSSQNEYQTALEATQTRCNELAKEIHEEKQKAVESREKRLSELSKMYKDPSFDEHFGDRAYPDDDTAIDEARLISEEEFKKELFLERSDKTLEYYQEDGILVDNGDVVENQLDILGSECIGMIDTTEEDFLYVSNDAYDTNYEVIIEHGVSYYRDILGIQ